MEDPKIVVGVQISDVHLNWFFLCVRDLECSFRTHTHTHRQTCLFTNDDDDDYDDDDDDDDDVDADNRNRTPNKKNMVLKFNIDMQRTMGYFISIVVIFFNFPN